jgi:hypothetical protein
MAVFWAVAPCSLAGIDRRFRRLIALMMEAANNSETSDSIYQTAWCNIPEDSRLHSRRRENLKSHEQLLAPQ